jgi:hypothetical protein
MLPVDAKARRSLAFGAVVAALEGLCHALPLGLVFWDKRATRASANQYAAGRTAVFGLDHAASVEAGALDALRRDAMDVEDLAYGQGRSGVVIGRVVVDVVPAVVVVDAVAHLGHPEQLRLAVALRNA